MTHEIKPTERPSLDDLELSAYAEDEANALRYIIGRDAGMTHTALAQEMWRSGQKGVSRQTLYQWIKRWDDEGILDKLREDLLLLQSEEIRLVVSQVIANWPDVVRRILGLALNGPPRVALESAEWLYARIVQPTLESKRERGARELNYTQSAQTFDPTSIPDGDIEVVVKTTIPSVIAPSRNGSG